MKRRYENVLMSSAQVKFWIIRLNLFISVFTFCAPEHWILSITYPFLFWSRAITACLGHVGYSISICQLHG